MSMYSIYFSPTGGTRRAAGMIAGEFADVIELDLLDGKQSSRAWEFGADDVCLISVPSFGGRIPALAAEQIAGMKGNGARAVLTAVYGNRAYDDTLLELGDCVKESGFKVVAAIAAIAEHSIVHDFGTGRPDREDEAVLRSFARRVRDVLEQPEGQKEIELPGNRPYREYHGVPFKPAAGEACTRCGLCAKKCPVQAIPEADPASIDQERCISCMRCIAVCPHQARELPAPMVAGAKEKLKAFCTVRKENELLLAR